MGCFLSYPFCCKCECPRVIINKKLSCGNGVYIGKVRKSMQGEQVEMKQNLETESVVFIKKKNEKELKILEKLIHSHYNIHLIGFSKHYILTEYCQQGDLFDWFLKHQTLSISLILDITRQIVIAMKECHIRGIVHSDIKLENIGLCPDEHHLRLLDYNAGIILSEYDKSHHKFTYTLHYTPPEIILHQEISSQDLVSIDYWEIGIVMFILLNGEFPFDGKENKEIYKKIIKGEKTWKNQVPLKVKNMVEQLLQTDPKKRLDLDQLDVNEMVCF